MKKPTAAQRRVLEAMRDGKGLVRTKSGGNFYWRIKGGYFRTGPSKATCRAIIVAGWIDIDLTKESGNTHGFRLMPSGLVALSGAR